MFIKNHLKIKIIILLIIFLLPHIYFTIVFNVKNILVGVTVSEEWKRFDLFSSIAARTSRAHVALTFPITDQQKTKINQHPQCEITINLQDYKNQLFEFKGIIFKEHLTTPMIVHTHFTGKSLPMHVPFQVLHIKSCITIKNVTISWRNASL